MPWLKRTAAPTAEGLALGRVGEVDAGDGADAPLGVRDAPGVAVNHQVVGDTRAERVVLCALFGGGLALALLRFPFAPARFLARPCERPQRSP